jgi:hypothetical protein
MSNVYIVSSSENINQSKSKRYTQYIGRIKGCNADPKSETKTS